MEHEAGEAPDFALAMRLLIGKKHRDERVRERSPGDQVEERIGQAKGRVVGRGLGTGPKERVEEDLPNHSQPFGGQVDQDEQEGGLRNAKTPYREIFAETETSQAERKHPSSPHVASRRRCGCLSPRRGSSPLRATIPLCPNTPAGC